MPPHFTKWHNISGVKKSISDTIPFNCQRASSFAITNLAINSNSKYLVCYLCACLWVGQYSRVVFVRSLVNFSYSVLESYKQTSFFILLLFAPTMWVICSYSVLAACHAFLFNTQIHIYIHMYTHTYICTSIRSSLSIYSLPLYMLMNAHLMN